MRYALFGSFTRVFGGSAPMSAALSGAHWNAVWGSLPVWLAAQFRPRYLYPFLVALTALQFALIAFAHVPQPRPREELFALASILVLTFVLLVPHVGKLPDGGIGGRFFYQSAAFYGVLVAIALRHARLPYLLWGASLALVLLHAAFQWNALARWNSASAQMRGLVAEVARLDREMQPGEYALVLTPALLNDIPFARHAQGGLMLPPVFDPPVSARLLVQNYDDIPYLPAKIEEGAVTMLRQILVWDYVGGKRVAAASPEYPTRVVCWDPVRRRLMPLPVDAGPTPHAWAQSIQLALASSACAGRTEGR